MTIFSKPELLGSASRVQFTSPFHVGGDWAEVVCEVATGDGIFGHDFATPRGGWTEVICEVATGDGPEAVFDNFGPFWGPGKNRSKVTSKNSGTLTGRTNDSHLRQKNDPQTFQKKLKKVTFPCYVMI